MIRRPKFGNIKTRRNGQLYDSRREADRHGQLQLLEKNGEVRELRRQVKYVIVVNGVRICSYTADFVYLERRKDEWTEVVEDVKGYPNDRWPMKKKLMKAVLGVDVRET